MKIILPRSVDYSSVLDESFSFQGGIEMMCRTAAKLDRSSRLAYIDIVLPWRICGEGEGPLLAHP